MTAVVVGDVVWAVLAAAVGGWAVATALAGGRVPGVGAVARWFLQCWLGRAVLLAGWTEVGWHLFCQRP